MRSPCVVGPAPSIARRSSSWAWQPPPTGVAAGWTPRTGRYDTLRQGNGQSGSARVTNVVLPWRKVIAASGPLRGISLNATTGACTTVEDGKRVATNSASGFTQSRTV